MKISQLEPLEVKSGMKTTSSALKDLKNLRVRVTFLVLGDLYEQVLSSILTGLQELMAHSDATFNKSYQTKSVKHLDG